MPRLSGVIGSFIAFCDRAKERQKAQQPKPNTASPICSRALFSSFSGGSEGLKDNWEELVQVASGYLELGMLEDAERALEKIASEDRKRSAVLAV